MKTVLIEWDGLSDMAELGYAFARPSVPGLMELHDQVLGICREFYDLPLDERHRVGAYLHGSLFGFYASEHDLQTADASEVATFTDGRVRGYSSYDYLTHDGALRAESSLLAHFWPSAEFRDSVVEVSGLLEELGHSVVDEVLQDLQARGISCSLDASQRGQVNCSILRLLQYPQLAETHLSKEHSDYEFLSLIASTSPGLEVLDGDDHWVPGHRGPGWFTVILGDMAEACTDGGVKAAVHRVRFGSASRLSVVYFYGLPFDFEVTYQERRIVFGEHLLGMLVRGNPLLSHRLESGDLDLGFPVPVRNPFRRPSPPT